MNKFQYDHFLKWWYSTRFPGKHAVRDVLVTTTHAAIPPIFFLEWSDFLAARFWPCWYHGTDQIRSRAEWVVFGSNLKFMFILCSMELVYVPTVLPSIYRPFICFIKKQVNIPCPIRRRNGLLRLWLTATSKDPQTWMVRPFRGIGFPGC